MADLDLYKQAYRDYLGREASDEEANNWDTGVYGGGSVQDRINQIATSGEAQARQQPVNHGYQQPETQEPQQQTAQPNARGSFDQQIGGAYEQFLGRQASPDELNNWWSGNYGYGSNGSNIQSMLGAISTSGEARARQQPTTQPPAGGAPTSSYSGPGPQGGNYDSWLMQLTQGKPPSPQTLKQLEPILNQYGIRLGPPNARGWSDGVFLPDGTFLDLIEGATENGGVRWQTLRPTGGVGGGQAPGNQYSDPYTMFLEQLIKSRIGNLQGGYDASMRNQYQNALQQRASQLGQGNQQLDQLMQYLQERFTDLKGPGYTGAENEVLRTSALDPVESDRTAAIKRVTEQLAARGLTMESGIAQQMLQEVNKQFDAIRGQNQNTLAANELGRRENRNQRAEMIGAQIADIPEQRAREQLDVFGALERLSLLARQEDEARSREAISYGGVLSDLGPQRLNLAMQAAGMGGNPSALGSVLTNIAGMNQNASVYNQQNQNSLWSGLGSLAAIIARSGQSGLSGVRV